MSTQYRIWKDDIVEIAVDERSSKLSLDVFFEDVCISTRQMTSEEMVEMAVKMIQPTLYNVEDPQKFFDEVIMQEIRKLFI